MMSWLFAVLVVFGVAFWLVRRNEEVRSRARSRQRDDIDHDILEQAEEEVRDLDIHARPDEGFVGDDWGPGSPKGL